jgi:ribosome production factor 1
MPKKMARTRRAGPEVIRKKVFRLKTDSPKEVDPKLLEKYRSVRQADKKRELWGKLRTQNRDCKRARREEREGIRKALGKKAPAKSIPKTKENLRKPDVTIVDEVNDDEIVLDEQDDEFAKYYADKKNPKVLITTSPRPSYRVKMFVREALWLFPNSIYRPRKDYQIKEITEFCKARHMTDLIVITERLKEPFEMIISHLPEGPTATFRLSNFIAHKDLKDAADRTKHYPELNLKNFDTRLGRRVGRMIEALFPGKRDFEGRAIVTFHNQRDFIFMRTHRYVFDSTNEVRIQELGPRFTMRLLTLQQGTFDTRFGEFEWFRKKEHDSDKLEWYM